jgi:hypothetical protein
MNIQLADKLLQKTSEAEALLLEIEVEVGKLAPDSYSNLECKKNLIQILKAVSTVREDLLLFREGKALFNGPKFIADKLNKKDSKNQDIMSAFKDLFKPQDDDMGNI